MISILDVTTIAFIGMIMGLAIAVLMLLNWRLQKRQSGVACWAAGFVMAAAGIILVGLRPYIPGWLSVLTGNVLLNAFWLCIWIGLGQFFGKPSYRIKGMAMLLAVNFFFIFYFFHLSPSVKARIVVFCLGYTVFSAMCAWEFFRAGRFQKNALIYLAGAGLCLAHMLFAGVRIVYTLQSPEISDLLSAAPIHKLAFIEGIIFSLVLAFFLIMMTSLRLREELEANQAKLEILAATDALSGLGNRRHFLETASREIERAQRYKRPLSLIMLDIDHFKAINDNHGHQCGDIVITTLGHMLAQKVRSQDIVCRIGGEEFAILMPETPLDVATQIAERLREALVGTPVPCEHAQAIHCTASFGVAELHSTDKSIYDLMPRADKGLYYAKHQGRNRIVAN